MAEGFVSAWIGIRLSSPPAATGFRSPVFALRFLGDAGEPPETKPWLWVSRQQEALAQMLKNTASQTIGAQMISATDGAAFSGSVTCYITGDGGTQSVGANGGGVCTHEGNGFHTYGPTQGETNFNHIGFTFIGSGAVPTTVNVYTETAVSSPSAADIADAVWDEARSGHTSTGTFGQGLASVQGNITGSVASVTGAVGSVTGNVGGSVASVTAGVTLADDAITASKFDESTAFPLRSADTGSTAVARTGADGDTLETLSDQLDAVESETDGSVWTE